VNDLYDTIDFAQLVSLNIWRVERCACVWPSRLSRPTSSSTAVTFYSVPTCFGLPLSCFWSVLPASRIFSQLSRPSLLQFIFENITSTLREPYSLNRYQFLTNALSSLLNGRLYYRYFVTALKIIIYNNIVCFCLQAPEMFLKLNAVEFK